MKTQNHVKVRKILLRVFHWLLIAGFFIAYLTGDELLTVHVWAGHLSIALLTLFLVFIPVFGVLIESYMHRDNLIKAMWNGNKTPECNSDS